MEWSLQRCVCLPGEVVPLHSRQHCMRSKSMVGPKVKIGDIGNDGLDVQYSGECIEPGKFSSLVSRPYGCNLGFGSMVRNLSIKVPFSQCLS